MIQLIDITPYSFLWVNVTTSLCMLIYIFATNYKNLIAKIPMWVTVVFTLAVSIRLLFPVEFLKVSYTFASYKILPKVDSVINLNTATIGSGFNVNIYKILCGIWGTVSVLLLFRYFFNYYKFCKRLKYIPQLENKSFEVLKELKSEGKYKFKTKLIQSPGVDFPAECGYFKQTIFLNEYEYTEDELRYILLHELAHFKYGTNWLGLLVNILEMVFWWNPVVHLYKRYINNIIEVYVDSKVTKGMNNFKKCEYIKCVFKVFEIILENNGPRIDYITPFMGKRSDKLLLERFKIIGYVNKVNIPMCISIILLVLTYVFVSCRFVVQPGWEPYEKDVMSESIDFNAENSYILEDNGVYYLYYNDKAYLSKIDVDSFPNVPIIKK